MATWKKWDEYLDSKSKLVEKPKTEKIADYPGTSPVSPPAAVTKGKNWNANSASPKEKLAPYKAGSDKAPAKAEKGLADQGDKKLIYEPDVDTSDKNKMGGKTVESWPKTKTEEFLDKTKDMDIHEFARYMVEECGCETSTDDLPTITVNNKQAQPYPPEAIRYVAAVTSKNENFLHNLIMEFKELGHLRTLLLALAEHAEFYDEITKLLGDESDGPKRCNSLVKAMNDDYKEHVAPPIVMHDDEEEEDDDTESDDDDMDDDSDDDLEPHDDMDGEDDMSSDDENDKDMDDDGNIDDEQADLQNPPDDLKKKFAHHHMMHAMANHPVMKKFMQGYV